MEARLIFFCNGHQQLLVKIAKHRDIQNIRYLFHQCFITHDARFNQSFARVAFFISFFQLSAFFLNISFSEKTFLIYMNKAFFCVFHAQVYELFFKLFIVNLLSPSTKGTI